MAGFKIKPLGKIRVWIFSVLLGVLIASCQKPEPGARTLNIILDDSLGIGTYDTLTVDLLDTNGVVIQAGLFSGPYVPGADHKLTGLVLPDHTPGTYVLRIKVYQGAIRRIEFTIKVSPNLVDNPIIVYRSSRDTAAPAAPVLQTISPARNPHWNWVISETGLTYLVRLVFAGQTRDSLRITTNSYTGRDSIITSEGAWTLFVIAMDSAGNRSPPSFAPINVDLTPPNLAITGPGLDARVTAVDPVLTGTASDSAGIPSLRYQLKNSAVFFPITVGTGGLWTVTATSLPAGACTLSVSASDAVGNTVTREIILYMRPNVVFVRQGGNRTGTSWRDAYGNLDSALQNSRAAAAGGEIWMDSGTYSGPTRIINGRRVVLGGFTTSAVKTSDRDPVLWKTTVQGILPNAGFNPSNDLVIDGVRFYQCANAFFTSYLRGKVEFRRCQFEQGTGPVAYVGYNPDSGSLSFINCQFYNNVLNAASSGSLIQLRNMAEILFDSCSFQGNSQPDTLGILNVESGSLIVRNSTLLDALTPNLGQVRYLPYSSAVYPNGNLEISNSRVKGGRPSIKTTLTSFIYQNNIDL